MCGYYKKESVELIFVYLLEGCGKTFERINDTMPHTYVRYTIGVGTPMVYIQGMSAVRCPLS